jgi:parallel beta-helix repeat protein
VKSLAFTITLISIIALSIAFARLVNAQSSENITIKADGSVDPSTAPVQRDGDVYSLAGDIQGSITIQRDNIVVEGAGYTVQAKGDTLVGISIGGRANVTVRNVIIQGFLGRAGILLGGSNNCVISNNNLAGNLIGVEISGMSSNNRIVENSLQNNEEGIELESATGSNNAISDNDVANNNVGITVSYFTNTNVFGNTLTGNKYGFFVGGAEGSVLRNNTLNGNTYGFHIFDVQGVAALKGVDVDISNKVNGKPIYYWVSQHDKPIPIDAGYVVLIGCINITVTNLNLSGNAEGVYLGSTENSKIVNNTLSNNQFGVNLDASINNTISENIVANNENGIGLGAGSSTISTNNVIDSNEITGNGNGVYIGAAASNSVTRNNITNSETGVYTELCGINTIYHNNFINNAKNWNDAGLVPLGPPFVSVSIWDDGKEGNYWSDYLVKYPNASEIDGSGIGNMAYKLGTNNTDRYPLISPFNAPKLTVSPSPTTPPSSSPSHSEQPTLSPKPQPESQPFSVTLVAVIVASVAVACAGVLIYLKKRNRKFFLGRSVNVSL